MECEGCGGSSFINIEESHVVCVRCGRQTTIKSVIYQPPVISIPSFSRSVRRVTEKQKKIISRDMLTPLAYLKHYQKVLELCVKDLVVNCGLPITVQEAARRLWSIEVSKFNLKKSVTPKNRRYRKPSDITKYDAMTRLELGYIAKYLEAKYPKITRVKQGLSCKIPTTLHCKQMLIECKALNLDPLKLKVALGLKDKASVLLYSYNTVMVDSNPDRLTLEELCIREKLVYSDDEDTLLKLVQAKEPLLNELKTEDTGISEPIPISRVLVICYLSSFIVTFESRPVLPKDLLRWANSCSFGYLTAWTSLEIPENFRSLFRPLHVPTSAWLIDEAQSMLCDQSFLIKSQRYSQAFLSRIGQDLSVEPKIPGLALSVYQCAPAATKWKELDLNLLSSFVIALKMEYGLNDMPYGSVTVNSSSAVNPSDSEAHIAWALEELQHCPSHLEAVGKLKGLEVKYQRTEAVYQRAFTVHTEQEALQLSSMLIEESHHVSEQGAELPAPSDDFIVYPPKHTVKYHAEYIVAVYQASSCLGYSVKSLNDCVYKLSRALLTRSAY
mmetsp:Transcript_1801/g.3908  ORF Transcript_1801/g.3908 Transcript_1801/m.3908 type:complete len:555 (+) Transcript_1801:54-1718(+)